MYVCIYIYMYIIYMYIEKEKERVLKEYKNLSNFVFFGHTLVTLVSHSHNLPKLLCFT